MRRTPPLLFALLISVAATGCEEEPAVEPQPDDPPEAEQPQQLEEPTDEPDEDDEEMTLVEPSEHSQQLLDAIADYEQWDYHAGLDTHYESGHPGDVWVIAYANELGIETVEQQELPAPEGSIFVKQEFDADGAEDPFAVTVMEKLSDESGDWYWLKADPELERVVEGPGQMALEGTEDLGCISCHGEAADNDYLMAPGVGDTE